MKDKSKLITIILSILLVLSLAGNIYLANNKDTDPKININKTYGGGGIDGKNVVDLTNEEYITIMDNTKIYLYRQNEPMKLGSIKLLAEPNLYTADIDGMDLYIFFNEDSINVVYDGEVYNYKQRAEGPTFLGQEGIDNIEKNDKAIFNVNSLEKIDLNNFKFNSDSSYYREASLVDIDGFELDKSMFYIVNDGTENNFIEVSEIMLEPIKLLYDYGSNGFSAINTDQLGYIKANDINLKDLKLIEKCIPINFDLKIEQEITLDNEKFDDNKIVSFWFYPICYEITYNKETVYRILKTANPIQNDEMIRVVADGLIEIRCE